MRNSNFFSSKSFSLIELMLVVSIIAILTILLINMMTSARMEARGSKILDLTDLIKHSCKMYESDTGAFVRVSTARPADPTWQGLTQDDGVPGWDGLYMQEALAGDDNPFGDVIWVSRTMVNAFDLDGDGATEIALGNNGNCVIFFGVPEKAVKYINDSLDKTIGGDWRNTGRVRYFSAPIERVVIYLIGGR